MSEGIDLYNKIKELEEKATKFEHLKGRYEKVALKMQEGMRAFQEALDMMNPVLKIDTKIKTGKRTDLSDQLEWAWDVLRTGQEVSSELIAKTFPDLTENQQKYVFVQVCKFKGCTYRKEGRTKYVYIDKTYN